MHSVPTSCSWLNLIERWFAELTNKRIRRDSFLSVNDLQAAIHDFLSAWNENPKPFVWTATVDSILAKLARCRQTLEQIQPGCTLPKTRQRKFQLIRGYYTRLSGFQTVWIVDGRKTFTAKKLDLTDHSPPLISQDHLTGIPIGRSNQEVTAQPERYESNPPRLCRH
jgi:hypothetical protein